MAPKSSVSYVLVAPCIPLPKGGHEAYTYHIENIDEALRTGSVVRISFGKRKILGVVLQSDIRRPRYPTKPIAAALPITLTASQLRFAKWIASASHGGLGYTLRLFIPQTR